MLTTTIAVVPLNLLQINSAGAQQSSNSNLPSSSTSSTSNSQQTPNMMQANNSSMNSGANPSTSTMNQASNNNLQGSISILSPIVNGFKSLIHVSLNDAITTAQNSLGGNSTTVAAFIHPNKGFIVYDIFALDSNNNVHKIVVDPGNGKILFSEQMSIMDMMMLVHGGGGMGMMMGPSGMDKGMMGHNMMMGPSGMDKGMMGHNMMMGPSGW
jgi:hypothetical protein